MGIRLHATTGRGFYGSDEGGEPWLCLARGLPPQCDVMVRQIAVDDTETVYIVAGHELFTSPDEGASRWRLSGDLTTVQALVWGCHGIQVQSPHQSLFGRGLDAGEKL